MTLNYEFGSINFNGFSYPEWWRDMDPTKPSNLFLVKKGAKPFADIYRLNDKSEWTFKSLSILIVEGSLFSSHIKENFRNQYIKEQNMTYNKRLFTSESVTEGHPDKIADQVSDAILDEILKDDPNARVACETTVTTGMALISGEISTSTYVDIPKVVRETIKYWLHKS